VYNFVLGAKAKNKGLVQSTRKVVGMNNLENLKISMLQHVGMLQLKLEEEYNCSCIADDVVEQMSVSALAKLTTSLESIANRFDRAAMDYNKLYDQHAKVVGA
jgi:hypothetical protein